MQVLCRLLWVVSQLISRCRQVLLSVCGSVFVISTCKSAITVKRVMLLPGVCLILLVDCIGLMGEVVVRCVCQVARLDDRVPSSVESEGGISAASSSRWTVVALVGRYAVGVSDAIAVLVEEEGRVYHDGGGRCAVEVEAMAGSCGPRSADRRPRMGECVVPRRQDLYFRGGSSR